MTAARLSVEQAARAGRCSKNTVRRLVAAGHLKMEMLGETGQPRSPQVILATRDEVRALVQKHAPGSGWKKSKLKSKAVAAPTASSSEVFKSVLEIAALGSDKLPLLLKLGRLCTVDDLTALLDLAVTDGNK